MGTERQAKLARKLERAKKQGRREGYIAAVSRIRGMASEPRNVAGMASLVKAANELEEETSENA